MKHFLLYLTFAFLVSGCHSSSTSDPAPNPAKNELATKLKAMTPDERRAYLAQHPDEVRKALPGFGGPPPRK